MHAHACTHTHTHARTHTHTHQNTHTHTHTHIHTLTHTYTCTSMHTPTHTHTHANTHTHTHTQHAHTHTYTHWHERTSPTSPHQIHQLVNDWYSQQQHQTESVFSPTHPTPPSLVWISHALLPPQCPTPVLSPSIYRVLKSEWWLWLLLKESEHKVLWVTITQAEAQYCEQGSISIIIIIIPSGYTEAFCLAATAVVLQLNQPDTSMTTSKSGNGRMLRRSLMRNSPLGWTRSDRRVPEFSKAISALVAVSMMSVIKFPAQKQAEKIAQVMNANFNKATNSWIWE